MSKDLIWFSRILIFIILVSTGLVGITLFSKSTLAARLFPTPTLPFLGQQYPTLTPDRLLLALGQTPSAGTASAHPTVDSQPALPLRAAFYSASYPAAWDQKGLRPFTIYTPSLGAYDSTDASVIRAHIAAMQYGNIAAGLVSWSGQGTSSDAAFQKILAVTAGTPFHWALVYELEAQSNPTVSQLSADLGYVRDHYAGDPAYLRISHRFVIFVSTNAGDNCETASRWIQANNVNAYVVIQTIPGYKTCGSQPDGWYTSSPSASDDYEQGYSYTISPGAWTADGKPTLARDLSQWYSSIRRMISSDAPLQLITSFNRWGEGSAVESAVEWQTSSAYGAYLDALHLDGGGYPPLTALKAPMATPVLRVALAPTATSSPSVVPATVPPSPSATVSASATARATPSPAPNATVAPAPSVTATLSSHDVVLAAAGDIACDPSTTSSKNACRQVATSDLLMALRQSGHLDAVAPLGDDAYDNGSLTQFTSLYDSTWGRLKSITHPTAGIHEYQTPGAAGYFQYFGAAAGDPGKGYYSYDLGAWHVIVLNSNCTAAAGCGPGSPQEQWLRGDLGSNANKCTLAYWHTPMFSSSSKGNSTKMKAMWQDLYNFGTSLVLNADAHDYERFAPQNADGQADPQGIREFVVGTGGGGHSPLFDLQPNTEVFNDNTYGVLKLTLHSNSYEWQFLPEPGKTFTDSGNAACQPRQP